MQYETPLVRDTSTKHADSLTPRRVGGVLETVTLLALAAGLSSSPVTQTESGRFVVISAADRKLHYFGSAFDI